MRLLGLIMKSLGLPERRFEELFMKDHMSCVRMFHYPPCPSPELVLGVGPHRDPGVLTILSQDEVGGLEVKRKPDRNWVQVKPIPNAYIINVGDIIKVHIIYMLSSHLLDYIINMIKYNQQKFENYSIEY